MAFNDTEISNQDGLPISLYTFEWGATVWRYTSADRDITREEDIDGVPTEVTYTALAISDNGMVQGQAQSNDFTITIPDNIPVRELFRSTPPSASVWITVRRKHFEDDDAPVYWIGTVGNVKGIDLATAEIFGLPLTGSFGRSGLRLTWQTTCPHILYDFGCKKDPADVESVCDVTAVSGNLVTMTGAVAPAGLSFRGGFIKWEAEPGTWERRGIEAELGGGVFRVYGRADRLSVTDTVYAYPGCPRSPEGCIAHDNLPNYGGINFMPKKSPFNGDQVF